MLPIVVVGLVAVVSILAWRGSQVDAKRAKAKLRQATPPPAAPKPKPKPGAPLSDRNAPVTLEQDPKTGVYRARKD